MQAAAATSPAASRQRLISSAALPAIWKPLRLLAAGAVTRVVLAEQPSGRRVAVKMLRPSLRRHPGARYLIARELRMLDRLQGSGVVAMLNGAGGQIVMEYLPAGDLLSLAGAPHQVWLPALATLAGALDRIHRLGLVHRDVRPENALFRSAATPVWIDFQATAECSMEVAGLSRGSIPYASPQQLAGLSPSPQDDVFSFGVLLYQLATGTLLQMPQGSCDPQMRANMAPALRAWTLAALAQRRSARPAGLGELTQILQALAERNDGDE